MKDRVGVLVALLAGALFGAGLLVSGMTQPSKIIRFLDVTRGWDPSLMFVMGGAIPIYALAFRVFRARERAAWCGAQPALNLRAHLDRPLLFGAAIFGVGWGVGGLCPGPGVVVLGAATETGLVFVAAMLVGMWVQHRVRGERA